MGEGVSKVVERKEKLIPFAMRFQEEIPEEDVVKVGGSYNEKTQMWEWPRDSSSSSKIMSFPGTERPPTTCIQPTRISPTITRADARVDD